MNAFNVSGHPVLLGERAEDGRDEGAAFRIVQVHADDHLALRGYRGQDADNCGPFAEVSLSGRQERPRVHRQRSVLIEFRIGHGHLRGCHGRKGIDGSCFNRLSKGKTDEKAQNKQNLKASFHEVNLPSAWSYQVRSV